MTVGELIAELQKHPPGLLVVTESGYDTHTTSQISVRIVNYTTGEGDAPAGQDVLEIR